MKTKSLLLWAGVAVVLVGGGGGWWWWWWWQGEQQAAILAAAVPAMPDLSHWPAAMQQRVARAQQQLEAEPVAALAELGPLYHANGFFAEAAQCYGGLEQLQPREPRWPHLHATILAGYGDTEPALALWQRVVALDPHYLPARLRLADVWLKRADLTAAAKHYRSVLAEDPRNPYAQLGLARCAFDAGRWEEARQWLEPLVAQTNFTLGYDIIATVYEKLGREQDALKIRSLYHASGAYRDPADPWVDELAENCYDVYRLTLASGSAHRNGDIPTAFRRIGQALALAPDQATLYFQRGLLCRSTKAYAKARQDLERCTQLQPDFADGWAHLAIVCEAVGDRAAADQALLTGLRHCPNSPGLHLQNAQRLVRDGRREEAVPEFQASIRLRPNEAPAYLGLASTLIALGRKEEAIAAVDGALQAEPEHPQALGLRAMSAIEAGDEPTAQQWTRRVLNQPRFPRELRDQLLAAYRQQFGHEFR